MKTEFTYNRTEKLFKKFQNLTSEERAFLFCRMFGAMQTKLDIDDSRDIANNFFEEFQKQLNVAVDSSN